MVKNMEVTLKERFEVTPVPDPKWHCPPLKRLHLALYWSGIL
jgi:hypothetical protein